MALSPQVLDDVRSADSKPSIEWRMARPNSILPGIFTGCMQEISGRLRATVCRAFVLQCTFLVVFSTMTLSFCLWHVSEHEHNQNSQGLIFLTSNNGD
jgi:hypothetical protein